MLFILFDLAANEHFNEPIYILYIPTTCIFSATTYVVQKYTIEHLIDTVDN